MLVLINHPVIWFFFGISFTIVAFIAWRLLCLIIEKRSVQSEDNEPVKPEAASPSEKDEIAQELLGNCQKRFLKRHRVNPDWIDPLKIELPCLIQDIARIYYPQEERPIFAPGMSEFSRAIELSAGDITSYLQDTIPGRMVDVSANSVMRTYEITAKIFKNKHFKETLNWYKRVRPIIQVLKLKSPFMWIIILLKNGLIRFSQVTIAGIVGKRAIELYSSRLTQ